MFLGGGGGGGCVSVQTLTLATSMRSGSVFVSPLAQLLDFLYDVFDSVKNNPIAFLFFTNVKFLFLKSIFSKTPPRQM